MKCFYRLCLLFLLCFSIASVFASSENLKHGEEQSNWQQHFAKYNANGSIVIVDGRALPAKTFVFNNSRASERFSPASTYKIPHTLFLLDAGAIKDEFQVFPWDGIKRGYEPHNQDQNLRSAMRYSALWLYEKLAKEMGEAKAQQYIEKIAYGNAESYCNNEHCTKKNVYWVDGKLAITAYEQIDFLKKLYNNQLPFKKEHQLLVKDIMLTEASANAILRAKTGWTGHLGWWVGWVEWPTGPVFFALNIDTPNEMEDLYKRQAIVKDVLKSISAYPLT